MGKLLGRFGHGKRAAAHALIGEADRANGERDWERAADLYRRALDIQPSLAGIHVQLGHALKEQGYLTRATQCYRQAVNIEPRNADTYLQLGHVLKLRGLRGEAARAYARAKSLDPVSDDIHREHTEAIRLGSRATARIGTETVGEDVRRVLDDAEFGQALADAFDTPFYFFANPDLGTVTGGAEPAVCLRHFCEQGLQRLAPIAVDCRFDPDFYLRTYLPDRAMRPVAAYRHWLAVGLWQGSAPNRAKLVKTLFGAGAPADVPDGFLRMAMEAQGNSSWTELFDQVAIFDLGEGRPDAAVLRRCFESLASRLNRGDRRSRETAHALLQRLMRDDPTPATRLAYADALRERHCLLEAAREYRPGADGGPPSARTSHHLSWCLDRLGRASEALAVSVDGLRRDSGLRFLTDTLANRVIDRQWAASVNVAEGDADRTRQALERTLADVVALTGPTTEPLPKRLVRRVAIVGNQGISQCRFYRIDQKIEQLTHAGFEVELFDHHADIAAFLARVQAFDAAIFYRVAAFYPMIQAIGRARELGLTTFYDIDDLIFDPAHYPPSLESFGGLIDSREHLGLVMGMPLYAAAMGLCEFGLASTATLAAAMTPIVATGRVFVHRNAFGSLHAAAAGRPPRRSVGDKVTFFYASATKAHKEDFQTLVEPALEALVRRYGDRISIVLAGHVVMTPRLESIKDNLVMHAAMPITDLWEILASADVNLAVLLPSVMADAKSEIKWMEAAMLGVPTVASDTATYREVIDDGVTGFLCGSVDEWTETLDRLVNDAQGRHTVGDRARALVLERYSIGAAAAHLESVMRPDPSVDGRPKGYRVVIVNVYYPPEATGGGTRVVHDNVKDLLAHYGDEVDIEVFTSFASGSDGYGSRSYASDGIRVTGVGVPEAPPAGSPVEDLEVARVFEAFLKDARPNLVHFHSIQRLSVSVVNVARRLGIPYVITVHDGWWISGKQFLLNDALRIETYAYGDGAGRPAGNSAADHVRMAALRPALFGAVNVIAVSEAFGALYRSCGIPNVIAIPNGISSDFQARPRTAGSGKVRLGFLGGLELHKGSVPIRAALESGPFENLALLVIDHAMTEGEHRQEVWGSVPVDILPKRPQGVVADLYARIDVLLAPSIGPESYGLVTREALLAGCWVVASDRGSIGEDVIDGRNGFVVDVSTMVPLRDVLARIDRDPMRFTRPPQPTPRLRTSSDQAHDLAGLYRSIVQRGPPA